MAALYTSTFLPSFFLPILYMPSYVMMHSSIITLILCMISDGRGTVRVLLLYWYILYHGITSATSPLLPRVCYFLVHNYSAMLGLQNYFLKEKLCREASNWSWTPRISWSSMADLLSIHCKNKRQVYKNGKVINRKGVKLDLSAAESLEKIWHITQNNIFL